MIDQMVSNVKFLEEGEEQMIKMVNDNEASSLKEHHDITLYKTLTKVQVPENDEKLGDLDKLCHIGTDIK